MKKIITLATLIMASSSVFAQFNDNQPQGGFKGNVQAAQQQVSTFTTAVQARQLREDTYVTLKGNIVEKIGSDDYTFQDSTGQIRVEIDDHIWQGQEVSPKDKVSISGKIDIDDGQVTIDVKKLQKH